MKISKLAAILFAAAGSVLLAGSIVVTVLALNRPAAAVKPTEEANARAQSVLSALDDGDLAAVGAQLYGQPALGLDREPATEEGKQIWNAYRDSISVTADENCFGQGANVYQTAQVTAMDIAQTLSRLDRRAGELLQQELDAAQEPAELLGEDGQISQALRDALRARALQEALGEPETVTRQIVFQLIEKDGQWWAVPDQALLDILSAGLN